MMILKFLFGNQALPNKTWHFSLLVYRVLLSGSLFFTHGWKKVVNYEQEIEHIPDPFGFGGTTVLSLALLANIVAPVLISLGLFTRVAILPILATTLSGLFLVHWQDPAAVRDIPLMYSLAFGILFLSGAGSFSLDSKWRNK